MEDAKKQLCDAVNGSPKIIQRYILDLISYYGEGAHLIQDLYEKEENIKGLTALILRLEGGKGYGNNRQ